MVFWAGAGEVVALFRLRVSSGCAVPFLSLAAAFVLRLVTFGPNGEGRWVSGLGSSAKATVKRSANRITIFRSNPKKFVPE